MSWIKPSAAIVAQKIDRIFENEKSESYYTLAPLDAAQQKKFDRVIDSMHVYLQEKWVKHENISSLDDRRAHVRGNANDVMKRLKNPAASSVVNRATDAVLDQLSHRAKNRIPLYSSVVPGTGRSYQPSLALSAPASEVGNALAPVPSLSNSAVNYEEPPVSQGNNPSNFSPSPILPQ